jgi:hypothetical protein
MNDYFQLQHDFVEVIQKEYAREEAGDSNGDNNDNENNHSCQIIKSKDKRRNYSAEEQLEIIRIYDSINKKTKAIKFLQVVCGYNEIYERKIKRWKTCTKKPMGRPISQEFESEVLDEYKRLFPPHTELLHDNLRVCGHRVLNREYVNANSGVMEKKWLKDPRTRSLQFTDRWIIGILKRSESPASVATGIAVVEGMA